MREKTPFEQSVSERSRPIDTFLGRIQRAVISAIDPVRGTCSVEFESTPGQRVDVALPILSLSYSGKDKVFQTSWQRYMPVEGAVVLCGFDTNGSVRILSYEAVSYEFLSNLQSENPFGWVQLAPGEFDGRSSGGAYYRGDAKGNLYLAGGMTSIFLDKRRAEKTVRAGLVKEIANVSVYRRGLAKRQPAPFLPELEAKLPSGVPPLANPVTGALPTAVEDVLDLRIGSLPPPLPSLPGGSPVVYQAHGYILDPDIDEMVGGPNLGLWAPLGVAAFRRFTANPTVTSRFLWRIYDSVPGTDMPVGTPGPVGGTPLRPFEWGINQLGESFINIGLGAVKGYNIWSPTAVGIFGNTVNVSGNVFLGGPPAWAVIGPQPTLPNPSAGAGGPAICGTPFVAALGTYLAFQQTAWGAVAAACAAIVTGTPPEVITLTKAIAAAASGAVTATSAFATSSAAWLSQSVFVSQLPAPPILTPSPYQL